MRTIIIANEIAISDAATFAAAPHVFVQPGNKQSLQPRFLISFGTTFLYSFALLSLSTTVWAQRASGANQLPTEKLIVKNFINVVGYEKLFMRD